MVDAVHDPRGTVLKFRLSKKDLYDIVRVNASRRPFRKVAAPALAGLVLLGHSLDGNYVKGVVWAAAVAALYWGVSHSMYLLHVYGSPNESLLVPQEITLSEDRMVVTSEHSNEEFPRPDPAEVTAGDKHLVVDKGNNRLVFLKSSFEGPEDFQVLKDWLKNPHQGPGS
jgi:hypothetical protein